MKSKPIFPFQWLFCTLLCIAHSTYAQEDERIDDPYLPPVATIAPNVSPGFHFSGANVFVTQVNVDANGNNILNDAANEPSLGISPMDPNKMVIGWRQFDNVQSNFRQAGFGYSTDAGQHWTFPGVINPEIFRSDPVLATDREGRFYYNSLTLTEATGAYHCDVFRSTGDGTWDNGVYGVGGDKAWMTIDQTDGPGKGAIYSNWTNSYSDCENGSNFTRSTDKGDNYEYCLNFAESIYWGMNAVGPDGALYMSSNNSLVLSSHNAWKTDEDLVWDPVSIADLTNTFLAPPDSDPNPGGIKGQSNIAVNHAPGALNGQVYVLQSVFKTDIGDPMDVMFTRSLDGGQTWSPAVRVNDDQGAEWQWFGTMSVAPNGRIDVVWLDTRDNPGTVLSSLYYSNSTDGGITWSPNERMSQEFDPHLGWPNQSKMGDYYHMVSDNEGAHLAWTATFNGEQDVYYAHITISGSATQEPGSAAASRLVSNTPNPFSDQTSIRYEIKRETRSKILIFNQMGELVRTLSDQKQIPGVYSTAWDGRSENGALAPGGIYHCCLLADGEKTDWLKLALIR